MLQIKNLSITHKKDFREILKDFSFVLNQGDKAVIIGEEGNGKSTLLKWIYDPERIEGYADARGERICTGERLGYLAQELPEEEKEKSVYEFFSEEERFWELTPKELLRLGGQLRLMPDFFYGEQKMNTLSGGEKVKAQMARLLMRSPTILLLDEPSNDIDIDMLEWLEKLIKESECPVLFISHDETLIEKTANVVIHIEQLKRKTESHYTVARMPYTKYIGERKARYEKQEQMAFHDMREKKIRDEKLRRIEQSVTYRLDNISRAERDGPGRLLKKKMKAVKSMEKRFEREDENMTQRPEWEEAIFFKIGENVKMPAGKTVLEFSLDRLMRPDGEAYAGAGGEAHAGASGETNAGASGEAHAGAAGEAHTGSGGNALQREEPRPLAQNIFLRVRGGEKVCIIGRNGAGKTTLLKRIAQELLKRQDIHACCMPQNYEELLDMDKTPVEYLSVTWDKEETTRIRTWLGSLKFTADEISHPISELSGGQKAKVLLLRMSMSNADVLILDEPTRNFSPLSGPVIRRMLRDYQGAILSISHDRKYIREVCTAVYCLTEDGLAACSLD